MSPLPVIALPGAARKSQNLFLAPCRRKAIQTEKKMKSWCFSFLTHPGAASKAAYAHRNSNGNVLDEWVCSFQITVPFPKKKQVEEINPFTCFLTQKQKVYP
ncbi:MAG: hypothetical protein EGR89_04745 [[Eubacterium] rectale]|nr:hypothetical protein [Agathobacter rectalis]